MVATDFDEGLHLIHGNHDQLMQVVMNLVLNPALGKVKDWIVRP